MPLACDCYYDDCDQFWWAPDDYSVMSQRRARVRCKSCNSLIDHGTIVAEFAVTRYARCEYEFNRFGEGDPEAIDMASVYLCEECADIWFSLQELGFSCVTPYENQRELANEYALLVRRAK